MPTTYEPIATTTLGSASTITFSSIPSTYTDLRIVLVGLVSSGDAGIMRFNSDTASNYSFTQVRGNGSTGSSSRSSNQTNIYIGEYTSTSIPSLTTIDIFSYAGSTFKTALITNNADTNGGGNIFNFVSLYRSTSAISSITLSCVNYTNFAVGTTATLYGIKAA
jgi:hypothetical protein